MIRQLVKYFLMFLIVMGIGGFLVAASGVIPIKASSGHWPITRWFLQFSKQRSVATYTLGMETPPLDEWGLILKGAGTYETNCRGCHGSPELQNPRVAQEMTPRPPYLAYTIPNWESVELFHIVKHGIKFTGMPAWPTQHRDDEVWAMVAFLRRFPELDAVGYRRIVSGDAVLNKAAAPIEGLLGPHAVLAPIINNCSRCHGLDGLGRGVGAFPKLAGQSVDYFVLSLRAFAREERHSGVMEPLVTSLTDVEMRELALYYAGISTRSNANSTEEARLAIRQGESIAQRGIPSQRVPACVACHGPGKTPRNPAYPILTGQYSDYLRLQLELFKENRRGGTAYAHLMRPIAARLTAEQMLNVALYFESLNPASDDAAK
jgi:cytochrome c553/cytochrome c5